MQKVHLPKNRESGQALVMVLVLLALGTLLILPGLNLTTTSARYHQLIGSKTLEMYSADSGLEYVLCKLYSNPGAYTETPLQESFSLNGRTVEVVTEYWGGAIYTVNSTATSDSGSSTTIQACLGLGAGSFSYVITAEDFMKVENARIDSYPVPHELSIHCNGNIELLGSNTWVYGDATAVGTIFQNPSDPPRVTGNWTEYTSRVAFPGDYSLLYRELAQQGGNYTGYYEVSTGQQVELGPLYIDGNLGIKPSANVTLTGTVYVTGTLLIENASLGGRESVCVEGDVTINNGSYASLDNIPIITSVFGDIYLDQARVDVVAYAPNGTVTCNGLDLYGAVGGKEVWISQADVFYASQLTGREDLPGGELITVSYSYK